MKKIKLGSNIRATLLTTSVLLLSAVSAKALAFGPERQTFTMANPADYVTFNSITDNPTLGDERNFVRIAEENSNSTYGDTIKLQPGKTYEVYIGYHNNAKGSLNKTGAGIARGTKVAVQYPTTVTPSQNGTISAIISATNAKPEEVWDDVTLTSDTDITLNYVVGSAKIYNDWGTNGSVLSTDLFSQEGTYIGLNELDGLLPGCAEYSGHILVKFTANTTEAKVEKTVSLDGENFTKEVDAKPGDELTFKVVFTNTGTTSLYNVTFHDELPEGLTLVEDTTYLEYSTEGTANKLTNLITENGYNTGEYGADTSATITYKVKIADNQDICESLVNNIIVDHDNGEITDGAIVNVKGDNCQPTPEEDCKTNPNLPGCKTCLTNPEMEGCQELPNTGPLEIILAIVIIAGIGGGGYYLYRTRRTLTKVENAAKGEDQPEAKEAKDPEDSSQKPDNMVK